MSGLIPFNNNGFGAMSPHLDSFYNMLDDFFSDSPLSRRSLVSDTFKVDVKDGGPAYHIDAELPGIKKEEIGLRLDESKFTITVNRSEESEDNKDNYIHRERRYSSMQRSIYLADADPDAVTAKLEDGVLHVEIPKQQRVETSKVIEIQ